MKRLIIFLLFVYASPLQAQDSTKPLPPLVVSGYAEVYYLYDFDKPANHTRPPFVYSHNRTNEVTLNLGYIKTSYNTKKVRANIALMTGTYANANMSNEPGVLKNIFETNIGMKLSNYKNLWLDAGILPSHIGFESAIGKDCWTLTRSILADNSPYYEAGARLSYKTGNNKWYLAFLLLNGWQRIQRVDKNNTPAFGTQLTFIPSEQLTFNSSTFIGNEYPDTVSRWRYFHNFYSIWAISKQWAIITGFDVGIEQKYKGSGIMNPWFSPVVLMRYKPSENWTLTGRWEYYNDKFHVIIPMIGMPFQVQGASLNVNLNMAKNLMLRLEGKLLWSDHSFYIQNNNSYRTNETITTSVCIAFE